MTRVIDFREAVHSQPEGLSLASRSITTALDQHELQSWNPGETVAFVAMGASSFSAHAAVAALTAAGIRAVNLTAADLADSATGFQPGDHYVIVSESGRSPEPIAAARRLTPGRRIAVTNFPGAAISDVADFIVPLGGFVDSRVYTIGYTSTLLAYSLLFSHAGVATQGDTMDAPDLVRQSLANFSGVAAEVAAALEGSSAVDFVGHGFSYASAAEGALLFREALRIHTAAFETYQYLHGPMEALGRGSALVVFGDGREVGLARQAAEAGVFTVLVTAATDVLALDHRDNLTVVPLPVGADGFARAIVEMVLVQSIALARSELTGIPVEEFLFHQDDTKLEESSVG
jgi:glutamine---fructose-6-phosphate transaminase (isomerizing)